MCVCMCVCIYIYMYIYTYIHVYICIYIYTRLYCNVLYYALVDYILCYVNTYIHAYIPSFIQTYMQTFRPLSMHIYMKYNRSQQFNRCTLLHLNCGHCAARLSTKKPSRGTAIITTPSLSIQAQMHPELACSRTVAERGRCYRTATVRNPEE